jgi:Domain of unknown function (DUF4123)
VALTGNALLDSLEQFDGRKFAVVDAAHFDDLQGELTAAGLPFLPLYLDERDGNVQAAGPHLVALSDRNAALAVAALVKDKPAVVWWVWPDEGGETQSNLTRHLRSINMAEIPADRYDAEPETGNDGGLAAALEAAKAEAHDHDGHDHPPFVPPVRYELVIFRHADPNVMAMLLPLLDAGQVSRLFGRAYGLVINAPDHGGLRSYPRPEQLPDMPNGWLRILPEQYKGLEEARLQEAAIMVQDYLQRVSRSRISHIPTEQLSGIVHGWVRQSHSLGVRGLSSHCRWAYLQVITGGKLMNSDAVLSVMTAFAPEISADDRVRRLLVHSAAWLRRRA